MSTPPASAGAARGAEAPLLHRIRAVINVAGRLRAIDTNPAIAFARCIEDARQRAYALAALATSAPVSDPAALYEDALDAAAIPGYSYYIDTDYGDGWKKSDADPRRLTNLAGAAPDEALPEVLDLAHTDSSRSGMVVVVWDRIDSLANSPRFTANNKVWTIHRLAPHLPQHLMTQGLNLVGGLEDGGDRGLALTGLAPYLPSQLFETGCRLALALDQP